MNDQVLTIKAKKIGVRLSAFREAKGVPREAISQWTGLSIDELERVENGASSLSLPMFEWIALNMGISIDKFLEGEIEQTHPEVENKANLEQYASLRNKIISLILRKTRIEQNKSIEEIKVSCNLDTDTLESYESGQVAIPWPVLECLLEDYQIPLTSLFNSSRTDEEVQSNSFPETGIPQDEIADFVRNPANRPYLDLARRLSEMDASKLRTIAETILEITH